MLIFLMHGTILMFIKFNIFGTQRLNGPRHLFCSFGCTTWHIFEPLCVFEPSFNTDKYGTYVWMYIDTYVCVCVLCVYVCMCVCVRAHVHIIVCEH